MAIFDSLTGEKTTTTKSNAKSWADKQAEHTKSDTRKKHESVQTYEQYLAAKSGESDNGGKVPVWRTADITQFIAKDVQAAMNTLKDTADIVTAYSGLILEVSQILTKITKANASLTETLINTLRDEVKDILDSLFAVGGVYYTFIPPDAKYAGGIDYFKRDFLNSLEDTLDTRRPQMNDTTTVNAVFMLAGAPNFLTASSQLDGFSKFLFSKEKESPYSGLLSSPIPPPGNFSLKTIFAPRLKSPLAKDELYTVALDGNSDLSTILRKVETWPVFVEQSATLLVDASWDMPEHVEFGFSSLGDTVAHFGFFKIVTHSQLNFANAVKYVREEVIITDWVMVRSPIPSEINAIDSNHEAVLTALNEQRDIESNELGLGKHTRIFRGDVIPGFASYQDSDIEAPDDTPISNSINGIPIPQGPSSSNSRKNTYYYKVLFAGVRRKFQLKYSRTSGDTWEVYGSQTSLQETAPHAPFLDTPIRSVTITDIGDVRAEDVFNGFNKQSALRQVDMVNGDIQPVYDLREDLTHPKTGSKSAWITSEFSGTKSAVNTTVASPVAAPEPNWYSAEMKNLLPPLKELTVEAKKFVDLLADNLIESVNSVLEMVEALEAEIASYDAWISKLMELMKAVLFPPMTGIHVLKLSSNKGIKGITAGFNKSFSGAPRSSSGEKDYPDSYIKYGSRMPIGGELADIGGPSFKKLLPTYNDRKEVLQPDGSYVVDGVTEAESSEHRKEFTTEMKTLLFGGSDDRNRRKNEPTDEEMRKLGIPMYDSQHFVGGFVFMFEKIGAYTAFIRLLQLDEFFNEELDKLKKSWIGRSDFDQVRFPSLNNIHTLITPRSAKLAKRTEALDNVRNSDDDAVNEEADLNASDRSGVETYDADGNCVVIVEGSEPYDVVVVPAILVLVVNGMEVIVPIDENKDSLSASDITDKINKSYLETVEIWCSRAQLSSEECAEFLLTLSPLASSTADGGLVFTTPPGTFGDRSRSFSIGSSSFALATNIKPGDKFLGINYEDELRTSETTFPHTTGDLILECEGYGVPTPDMYRSSPAVYDYANFVSDPLIQDFSTSRHKIEFKIDNLETIIVDVTGDGGTRPSDRAPVHLIGGGSGDLVFPIQIDATGHKFRVEVDGSFIIVSTAEGLILENFTKILVGSSGLSDFRGLGIRPGDIITFSLDGGNEYTTTIDNLGSDFLIITNNITGLDRGVVNIESVVRGGLPTSLSNGSVISAEVSLPVPSDLNEVAIYEDLEQLMQAFYSGLNNAGLSGIFEMSVVDTSVNGDLTKGSISLTLGSWGFGTDTRMSFLSAGYVGSSAAINSVSVLGVFPLTVDKAKTKFRIELFGADDVSIGLKTITIPEGIYASAPSFVSVIQNSLDAQGLSDVKAKIDADNLLFYINSFAPGGASLPEHYSYSSKVGITVQALESMDEFTEYTSFPDGVALPPSVLTDIISFPLDIGIGRGDIFYITATPNIPGRISTFNLEVTIPPGSYNNVSELRSACESGLTKSGLISGVSGFIRVDVEGTDKLRFTLRPESGYVGIGSALAMTNGRTLAGVTLLGGSGNSASMRDYGYEKVFDWLVANPSSTPTPGFPVPPPLAFVADDLDALVGLPVYDGTWDIGVGANDGFFIEIKTPITGPHLGEKSIVVAPGTYANFPDLITGIQTSVDLVYGSGMFLITDTGAGDGIGFSLVKTELFGGFTSFSVTATGKFASMGSQTPGAMLISNAAGSGDVRFLELVSGSEKFEVGSDSLFAHLGIPALTANGVSDFNLLRVLGVGAVNVYGTYKVVYLFSEILENLNNATLSVNPLYTSVFTNHINSGRLRVTGNTRGVAGLVAITAVEDSLNPVSKESSEVAELLFGFVGREGDINVKGVGKAMSAKTLVSELIGPEYSAVLEDPGYLVQIEGGYLIAQIEKEGFIEQVATVETL